MRISANHREHWPMWAQFASAEELGHAIAYLVEVAVRRDLNDCEQRLRRAVRGELLEREAQL